MYSPNFTITNSTLTNISRIDSAKAIIDASPLLPSWEKKFQDDATVRSVHHGTHLEGNALDLSEAKRVMEGEKIVARERDIQEVLNYRNVLRYIGNTKKGIIENTVKEIHKLTTEQILPSNETGQYRRKSVVIRNSKTDEISFRPPPAVEIPYLMKNLATWINSSNAKTHPVLVAGIAHYEIARIHPFIDGNGRVARALTMLFLYQKNYDIRRFFSLEEYYDRNASAYYQALQSVNNETIDLTPWIEYFTEGLAIEFTRIKEKIEKISSDLKFKNYLGGQIYLNDRQLKIIEHIQEYNSLQNPQFPLLFPNISEDTVLRELKDLINKGIIKKKGKTKASRYVLV